MAASSSISTQLSPTTVDLQLAITHFELPYILCFFCYVSKRFWVFTACVPSVCKCVCVCVCLRLGVLAKQAMYLKSVVGHSHQCRQR